MSPADMLAKLDALHAAGNFHGLTIWPWKGGFQVSLSTTAANSWRIRFEKSPSEGLAAVLEVDELNNDGLPMPWPLNRTRVASEPAMLAPPAVDEPPIEELIAETEAAGIFD